MKKILIAEDDHTSRIILTKTVESLGYTAIQTSSGLRAWHIIEDNPDIQMLITDLMMPEMDGKSLVQTLRANSSWKDLPILMVSAVVPLKEIVGILDLGASRFLPKPVNITELKSYIQQYMEEDSESRNGTGA